MSAASETESIEGDQAQMERKRLGRRPSFADYVRRHGRRARDSVNRGMVATARRSRLGHYVVLDYPPTNRFARRAIEDAGLRTRIVSIDPSPRNEIDDLCDEVVRQPLELADRTHFAQLRAGDVIFLDGSHRVFTGSDATVFFLDLLPELPPGVLVGVHDVYLPDDYPEEIADRHYSEQYLLAAYVLAEPSWLRPVLPAAYVSERPELAGQLDSLWGRPRLRGIETHGVAFWFEIADRG